MHVISRRNSRFALLALVAVLAAAPAMASDDCDVPIERWQSRDAVQQMAAGKNWQIQRLKIDDGCYEIRGRDENGRAFKAKLDPETLQIVKMKSRDRARDHKRERSKPDARERGVESRSRDGRNQMRDGTPDASAPAAITPFTPGSTPRGQVN